MSTITKSGIALKRGPNAKREPGRVHDELHAPCGCAFHERPAPHWHPCASHALRSAGYSATLRVETLVKARDHESITVMKRFTLPFLPRLGDKLALNIDNDYLEVEDVYWDPRDGFDIWCKALEYGPKITARMLKAGWKEFE